MGFLLKKVLSDKIYSKYMNANGHANVRISTQETFRTVI